MWITKIQFETTVEIAMEMKLIGDNLNHVQKQNK